LEVDTSVEVCGLTGIEEKIKSVDCDSVNEKNWNVG